MFLRSVNLGSSSSSDSSSDRSSGRAGEPRSRR